MSTGELVDVAIEVRGTLLDVRPGRSEDSGNSDETSDVNTISLETSDVCGISLETSDTMEVSLEASVVSEVSLNRADNTELSLDTSDVARTSLDTSDVNGISEVDDPAIDDKEVIGVRT